MAARSRHSASTSRLVVLLFGITSVVAACGGNDSSPTATSGNRPAPTSGATATATSAILSRGRRQDFPATTDGSR